jgi:hypothetical protein
MRLSTGAYAGNCALMCEMEHKTINDMKMYFSKEFTTDVAAGETSAMQSGKNHFPEKQ